MKILFVTNQFPSKKYPYKVSFIYTQVKELINQGTDIVVLTPNYGKEEKITEYKGINIYRFHSFTKQTNDPLLRNLFRGLRGKLSLILFLLFQIFYVIKLVRKEKIDLIHAQWVLPSGFSALIASKILRRKLIITANGSDITFCGMNKLMRKFLCFTMSKSNLLVSVSENLRNKAIGFCTNEIISKTIYLGIPKNIIQNLEINEELKKKNDKYHLICVGSLYPVKGIDYLLRSIKILTKKRQDFVINVIGDGELMVKSQSFIKKNKLENFCNLLGFLPHDETLKLINKSDLCIQSSISEGLSVYIEESIYLGKPIVATNVGGTNEIVIDGFNGYLVKPKNPENLADKIDMLLSNPDQMKLFGQNSKEIAKEKLSLERNITILKKCYQEILLGKEEKKH